MTIQRAVELLLALKATHGDVEVLFDCQHCGKSTRPGVVVAMAVVQDTPGAVSSGAAP